ncbi:hypothetical protein PoB_002605900 [Plakobranchus ocellatus]|uniref:Uncharacterized protein n=1 Tax=Plakobranchus ocellatus TaxID=259542 RepID=A0AAV3ZW74_9GAST|nr:hypothetical protein PoB_002605900 [Plakobranchus ocellatus]
MQFCAMFLLAPCRRLCHFAILDSLIIVVIGSCCGGGGGGGWSDICSRVSVGGDGGDGSGGIEGRDGSVEGSSVVCGNCIAYGGVNDDDCDDDDCDSDDSDSDDSDGGDYGNGNGVGGDGCGDSVCMVVVIWYSR